MKKYLSIILSLIMLLSALTSCAEGDPKPSQIESTPDGADVTNDPDDSADSEEREYKNSGILINGEKVNTFVYVDSPNDDVSFYTGDRTYKTHESVKQLSEKIPTFKFESAINITPFVDNSGECTYRASLNGVYTTEGILQDWDEEDLKSFLYYGEYIVCYKITESVNQVRTSTYHFVKIQRLWEDPGEKKYEMPDNTDLEFWILDKPSDEVLTEYQQSPCFGARLYLGKGYTSNQSGNAYVEYMVTSFPDALSRERRITAIRITDPDVRVYGLTFNSSIDEWDEMLKKHGYTDYVTNNPPSNSRIWLSSDGAYRISVSDQRITFQAFVTNTHGIIID